MSSNPIPRIVDNFVELNQVFEELDQEKHIKILDRGDGYEIDAGVGCEETEKVLEYVLSFLEANKEHSYQISEHTFQVLKRLTRKYDSLLNRVNQLQEESMHSEVYILCYSDDHTGGAWISVPKKLVQGIPFFKDIFEMTGSKECVISNPRITVSVVEFYLEFLKAERDPQFFQRYTLAELIDLFHLIDFFSPNDPSGLSDYKACIHTIKTKCHFLDYFQIIKNLDRSGYNSDYVLIQELSQVIADHLDEYLMQLLIDPDTAQFRDILPLIFSKVPLSRLVEVFQRVPQSRFVDLLRHPVCREIVCRNVLGYVGEFRQEFIKRYLLTWDPFLDSGKMMEMVDELNGEEKALLVQLFALSLDIHTVAAHIKEFKIADEGVRARIAQIAAAKDGLWVAEHIHYFEIDDEEVLDGIVELCATCCGSRSTLEIAKDISHGSLRIRDEGVRARIAERVAAIDALWIAEHIHDFEIKDEKARAKIAEKIAAKNGQVMIEHIHHFALESDEFLEKVIEVAIAQDKMGLIKVAESISFGDLNIKNKELRARVAEQMAAINALWVIEHIHNFAIDDEEDLEKIIEIAAMHNPMEVAECMGDLGIKNEVLLAKIVEMAAAKNALWVAEHMHDFAIDDEVLRTRIAKKVAAVDGLAISRHIQNFRVLKENERILIAEVAAKSLIESFKRGLKFDVSMNRSVAENLGMMDHLTENAMRGVTAYKNALDEFIANIENAEMK